MSDLDFDPELFGLWPKAPVYDGMRPADRVASDRTLERIARQVILDTKAQATPTLDDLQDMLNGMTRELREQMQQFQRLRRMAEMKGDLSNEEIDRKTVQADAKASIEAMSVIVRTLEKIDSLQRTIAHDRQVAAETDFDEEKYRAFAAEIDDRVERRAQELCKQRMAELGRSDGPSGSDPPGADNGDAARGLPEG